MKRLIITSIVLLAGISAEAMAVDCVNNQLKNSLVTTAVSGKTVCATNGGDKWQEFHQGGGALIDYKKGPNDLVDKTKTVGSWNTSGSDTNTTVDYTYGAQTYSYKVFLNSGQYTFCGINGAPTLDVTLLAGQVSCGF